MPLSWHSHKDSHAPYANNIGNNVIQYHLVEYEYVEDEDTGVTEYTIV